MAPHAHSQLQYCHAIVLGFVYGVVPVSSSESSELDGKSCFDELAFGFNLFPGGDVCHQSSIRGCFWFVPLRHACSAFEEFVSFKSGT
jgi:hypothetical protein